MATKEADTLIEYRKGTVKFERPWPMSQEKFDLLARIQKELVIIEATNHFIEDSITLRGYSEQFRALDSYERIPEYRVLIATNESGLIGITFEEIK